MTGKRFEPHLELPNNLWNVSRVYSGLEALASTRLLDEYAARSFMVKTGFPSLSFPVAEAKISSTNLVCGIAWFGTSALSSPGRCREQHHYQTYLNLWCTCYNWTYVSTMHRVRFHYEDPDQISRGNLFHNSYLTSWRQNWGRKNWKRMRSCKSSELCRSFLWMRYFCRLEEGGLCNQDVIIKQSILKGSYKPWLANVFKAGHEHRLSPSLGGMYSGQLPSAPGYPGGVTWSILRLGVTKLSKNKPKSQMRNPMNWKPLAIGVIMNMGVESVHVQECSRVKNNSLMGPRNRHFIQKTSEKVGLKRKK